MTDKDANGVVQPSFYQTDIIGGTNNVEYDNLDKNWKIAHHMSGTTSDTTGAYAALGYRPYGNDTDKPDNEAVADIQALKPMFENGKTLWKQDWSDQGIQFYTTAPPSFLKPHPQPSGEATLFYEFTPVGGLPVDVFSLDDVQNFLPTGETLVRSLDDLGP